MTDRELLSGCARVRTKCIKKHVLICEDSLCPKKTDKYKCFRIREGGTLQPPFCIAAALPPRARRPRTQAVASAEAAGGAAEAQLHGGKGGRGGRSSRRAEAQRRQAQAAVTCCAPPFRRPCIEALCIYSVGFAACLTQPRSIQFLFQCLVARVTSCVTT